MLQRTHQRRHRGEAAVGCGEHDALPLGCGGEARHVQPRRRAHAAAHVQVAPAVKLAKVNYPGIVSLDSMTSLVACSRAGAHTLQPMRRLPLQLAEDGAQPATPSFSDRGEARAV